MSGFGCNIFNEITVKMGFGCMSGFKKQLGEVAVRVRVTTNPKRRCFDEDGFISYFTKDTYKNLHAHSGLGSYFYF